MKTLSILSPFTVLVMTSTLAHADFFPQSMPTNQPTIRCHNTLIETPESRLSVQIYAPTPDVRYPYVSVQQINTNEPTQEIFSGSVTEKLQHKATLLFGEGINLQIVDGENGYLKAQVNLIDSLGQTQTFNLNCETIYQVMPVPTKTAAL